MTRKKAKSATVSTNREAGRERADPCWPEESEARGSLPSRLHSAVSGARPCTTSALLHLALNGRLQLASSLPPLPATISGDVHPVHLHHRQTLSSLRRAYRHRLCPRPRPLSISPRQHRQSLRHRHSLLESRQSKRGHRLCLCKENNILKQRLLRCRRKKRFSRPSHTQIHLLAHHPSARHLNFPIPRRHGLVRLPPNLKMLREEDELGTVRMRP